MDFDWDLSGVTGTMAAALTGVPAIAGGDDTRVGIVGGLAL